MKYLYFDTNLMDEKYILAFGEKKKKNPLSFPFKSNTYSLNTLRKLQSQTVLLPMPGTGGPQTSVE